MNAKPLWEMSIAEFEAAAKRGRLVRATEIRLPGESEAATSLKKGELNGYGADNIAHFYVHVNRDVHFGYIKLLEDAAAEGRCSVATGRCASWILRGGKT